MCYCTPNYSLCTFLHFFRGKQTNTHCTQQQTFNFNHWSHAKIYSLHSTKQLSFCQDRCFGKYSVFTECYHWELVHLGTCRSRSVLFSFLQGFWLIGYLWNIYNSASLDASVLMSTERRWKHTELCMFPLKVEWQQQRVLSIQIILFYCHYYNNYFILIYYFIFCLGRILKLWMIGNDFFLEHSLQNVGQTFITDFICEVNVKVRLYKSHQELTLAVEAAMVKIWLQGFACLAFSMCCSCTLHFCKTGFSVYLM